MHNNNHHNHDAWALSYVLHTAPRKAPFRVLHTKGYLAVVQRVFVAFSLKKSKLIKGEGPRLGNFQPVLRVSTRTSITIPVGRYGPLPKSH